MPQIHPNHEPGTKISRRDRLMLSTSLLGASALVTAAAFGAAPNRTPDAPTPKTKPTEVTRVFHGDVDTNIEMARQLRQADGATESVRQLVDELNVAEPGADNNPHEGQSVTVTIDAPKQ